MSHRVKSIRQTQGEPSVDLGQQSNLISQINRPLSQQRWQQAGTRGQSGKGGCSLDSTDCKKGPSNVEVKCFYSGFYPTPFRSFRMKPISQRWQHVSNYYLPSNLLFNRLRIPNFFQPFLIWWNSWYPLVSFQSGHCHVQFHQCRTEKLSVFSLQMPYLN